MVDDGFEDDLNRAYEAFMGAKHASVFGKGGRKSSNATNFWEWVDKHSHNELENMIAHLERNHGRMSPAQIIEYHLRIVTYFGKISHLRAPGTRDFNPNYLEQIAGLQRRKEDEDRLVATIKDYRYKRSEMAESRARLQTFMDIMYEHLYVDKRALVDPGLTNRLVADTDVKARAFVIFQRVTGIEHPLAKGYKLPEVVEDSDTTLSLVPIRSSVPATPTREVLNAMPLEQKVRAYVTCAFFLDYFDRQISEVDGEIRLKQGDLNTVRLKPNEATELNLFKSGAHTQYSPSAYFAAYTNAAWVQLRKFIVDLHRAGVPVQININF